MDEEKAMIFFKFMTAFNIIALVCASYAVITRARELQLRGSQLTLQLAEEAQNTLNDQDHYPSVTSVHYYRYVGSKIHDMDAHEGRQNAEGQTLANMVGAAAQGNEGEETTARNDNGHGGDDAAAATTTGGGIKNKVKTGISSAGIHVVEIVKSTGTVLAASGRVITSVVHKRFKMVRNLFHRRRGDTGGDLPITQMREWQVLATGGGGHRPVSSSFDYSEATLTSESIIEEPKGTAAKDRHANVE